MPPPFMACRARREEAMRWELRWDPPKGAFAWAAAWALLCTTWVGMMPAGHFSLEAIASGRRFGPVTLTAVHVREHHEAVPVHVEDRWYVVGPPVQVSGPPQRRGEPGSDAGFVQ